MSYDASHRRPPRQERWPHATPQEGWPAYLGGDGPRDGEGAWGTAFAGTRSGHAAADGYGRSGRYGGTAQYGGTGQYGDTWDGYAETRNGYPSYPGTWDGNGHGYDAAQAGYDPGNGYGEAWDDHEADAGYLDRDEYGDPDRATRSGPLLIAPDTIGGRGWRPDRDESRNRDRDRSGLIIGAVMGFLAAAVAIGVSTFAAAFVRPQASPIIAVGGAFIDRTPSALKNFAVQHFGENDKTVLLGGMYVAIGVIAMVIGCLARRNVTIGVAGIAAFGLFGAFVAITRPDSHVTDVMPSVIGGIAGVAALLWLARAAAPVAPLRASTRAGSVRHARASGHRRAR